MAIIQQFLLDKSGKPFINVTGSFGWDGTAYDGNFLSIDKNDRIYYCGFYREDDAPGWLPSSGWLAQYSELGNLNWQKSIGGSNATTWADPNENLNDTAISPDEEYVYSVGYTGYAGDIPIGVIVKYNKDGTLQWKKEYGNSGDTQTLQSCETDSSGNLYVAGDIHVTGTSNYLGLLTKFNSSGVIQWQKSYSHSSAVHFRHMVMDSSNNIYIAVDGPDAVIKVNSAGVIQWQKSYSRGNNFFAATEAIAVDTSGNVFICGYSSDSNSTDDRPYVLKVNSSGTVQWARYCGNYNDGARVETITCDNDDNVYVFGLDKTNSTPYNDSLIVKYNSSGTLQWKRTFGISAANQQAYSIKTDSRNNVVIAGNNYSSVGSYGHWDHYLARLPNDGTKTGTYTVNSGSWVYQSTSISVGSLSGFSDSNLSNSLSNLNYTISNSSLSDGNYTHSSATVVI